MANLGEIDRKGLKLSFLKPEGKISRRELFKLALPHYEVVPFIESGACQGSQECGLCLDVCPLRAIKVEAGEVVIDDTLCKGCGACLTSCPHRAIVYPGFSIEQMDNEIAAWFASSKASSEPRVVALICQKCLSGQINLPACLSNLLPLSIPCLAMASPWLMLRPFDLGAQGLALICSHDSCSLGLDSSLWLETVQLIRELLGCWNIEPERIKVLEVDNSEELARELARLAREIAGMSSIPLRKTESTPVPSDGLLLPALVNGLLSKLGRPPKTAVTASKVPFGILELDGSRCTGCGLCVRDCPTGALAASSSEDGYQLLFKHDYCVACGRCIEVCPEQCLGLEHVLDLDLAGLSAAVLFEDDFARCRRCGQIIGSRAMIDSLRVKMSPLSGSLSAQLELCPRCKAEQSGLVKSPGGDNSADSDDLIGYGGNGDIA